MKFRIKLSEFEKIQIALKLKDDITEFELEPVIETATRAIYEESLKREAFEKGYHHGYRDGFHDGNEREHPYRCTCGCGGTTCWNRHCGKVCP